MAAARAAGLEAVVAAARAAAAAGAAGWARGQRPLTHLPINPKSMLVALCVAYPSFVQLHDGIAPMMFQIKT